MGQPNMAADGDTGERAAKDGRDEDTERDAGVRLSG